MFRNAPSLRGPTQPASVNTRHRFSARFVAQLVEKSMIFHANYTRIRAKSNTARPHHIAEGKCRRVLRLNACPAISTINKNGIEVLGHPTPLPNQELARRRHDPHLLRTTTWSRVQAHPTRGQRSDAPRGYETERVQLSTPWTWLGQIPSCVEISNFSLWRTKAD